MGYILTSLSLELDANVLKTLAMPAAEHDSFSMSVMYHL